ncbi:hypothetical protein Rsub_04942 [Raphidocelis subcapitata]|uniref:Uncharacterized protein n=1 Tax=Raphidocelis subcapitata TaxID=307507 RepID=A0A2V0P3Q0_9CHLO|nr:hypothetical protein Rsub_04942 [Raphidocelis subcapitata]|eukprot:GBF91837.1 hypothetical protein Rsub_04942 [Raphidocelis subcapitata]
MAALAGSGRAVAQRGARPAPCAAAHAAPSRPAAPRRQRPAAATQRRAPRALVAVQAGSDNPADQTKELSSSAFDFDEPETAREAIDLGLVLCKQEKWDKALAVFERAMTLPGTGVKRYRDKPRLISDGERMAALYNCACCHARLGAPREGLLALSACLEAGYADFPQIQIDPDLELLRQDPRYETLVARFKPKAGGFLGLKLPW